MFRAELKDKERIVDILTTSFDDNYSVNYIVKQDKKRKQRIRRLMEYSFDVCHSFGKVYMSDDKRGCALIVLPDKKKTTFKSVLLDVKLALSCVGLFNLKKTIDRESKIKKLHPKEPMYYLWFIGVDPAEQNKGIGTKLLTEVISESLSMGRSIYLETSTLKNIPWYEKSGFSVYNQLDFGYQLFFLRKE